MIPETALAMLACSRIGAVHSVVFGGFAAKELAKRIQDSRCKMVISASCGLEPKGALDYKPLVDDALLFSEHKPEAGLLWLRREGIQNHEAARVAGKNGKRNAKHGLPEGDLAEELQLTRGGKEGVQVLGMYSLRVGASCLHGELFAVALLSRLARLN